ncbi:MAG TPA: DUF4388 domain-containing protein, partial [Gemmatimonadaceae bacterium]|nr:DUF4388 domain-containing protein [Gemmatimonadaceae bacterium]
LQLLAMGRKTGRLALTHRSNFGSIWFDAGRISYASIVNRRDRIGERLVQAGVISAEALRGAIEEQGTQPDARIGDVLVEHGVVARDVLNDYLRVQVEETVFLLYTWNEGVFTFDPGARAPHELLVSINPESLMLEGARRVDEWSLISPSIPAFDVVFAVQRRTPTDALTAEQEFLLRYIDGRRDVTHLGEAAGLSEFDVGKVLHELLGAGIIGRVERTTQADLRAVPRNRIEEHRNLGIAFFRTNMLDEALREFRRVLELDATDVKAESLCALILLRSGAWDEAADGYRRITAHADAPPAAFHNLALALEHMGDLEGARVALENALERGGSDDPRIHTSLGAVHLLLGDVGAADAALVEADALSQPHPAAAWYHYAALSAAWQSDLTHARSILEDGIARHPHSAALHNNLSVLLERSGDASHALQAAQRGAAEDAHLPQLHKNVGDLYYRSGRYDDARTAFERAVGARPDLGGDVYLKLGNIHLRQRRTDDAIACWGRALEMDPHNAIARKNLEAVAQTRAVAVS